ncbi:MAG: penicillin-binding protein [Bacteroidota bacterium]
MTDIKKDILWRVYLMYFGILIFGMAIIGKIVYIQFKEGAALTAKAQTQELKVFDLEANRGNILDNTGNLLATSVPIFEVRFDVSSPHISDKLFRSKIDSIAYGLSKILNKSQYKLKTSLTKARNKGNRYFLIKRNVTYDQLKQIRELPIFRNGKYRGGLITIQKTRRAKPYNELAARTIGYVNETENLFVGLEGAYTKVLTGTDGKQVMRRINHGDWIPIHDENEIEPRDGLDIVSTININIQDVAEHALLRQLLEHKAFQGCAIVMEVGTGKIVAIANLRYDSSDAKYKETYNYAIGESIEPGSTFKLASILAALEDNKTKLTDSLFTGEGYTTYYRRAMRDVHKIGNGRITVRDAFEQSSNVGISRMIYESYKEHPEEFVNRLYAMSLNEKLGVELKGEGKPRIKHPSKKKTWYGTSLPWMSIGYELTITPLQTLTYYNAIANNGVMVKPMFVSEIREGGTVIEKFNTEIINEKMVSQSTVDSAKSLLEGVVERGTAKRAFKNSPYKVAGKTGTAQIAVGGKYNKTNYNASFVGYFPADNPVFSAIVVINNPSSGKYYGGSVAAPVFKEIADNLYSTSIAIENNNGLAIDSIIIPIPKKPVWTNDIKSIYASLEIDNDVRFPVTGDWMTANNNESDIIFDEVTFRQNLVPNVVGMKAKDAIYLLENSGLQTSISGKGKVIRQSVRAGKNVKDYQSISLQLATY